MKISVIMSVYNNAEHIGAAVDSILAQDFTDFEFLIVDDGSTDGSGEALERYAARDSRIRLFRRANQGLVASLNFMIAEARGDLLARMDGDDVAYPGRFAAQAAFLDKHAGIGVLGTHIRYIDETGAPRGTTIDYPTRPQDLDLRPSHPLLCHPTVTMRREIAVAAGGYRKVYKHCEDYDLWLRLAAVTGLCSLPARLLDYRIHSGQVSDRHLLAQLTGAAIAYQAHLERAAGRPDPIDGLDTLPAIEDLDAVFGRPGVSRAVRNFVVETILYSPEALAKATALIATHVREGDGPPGLWRAVIRLIRAGKVPAGLRIAAALLRGPASAKLA